MVWICVTWDGLLVLLDPPQDSTSCRAGARPGHPISRDIQPVVRPQDFCLCDLPASMLLVFSPNELEYSSDQVGGEFHVMKRREFITLAGCASAGSSTPLD